MTLYELIVVLATIGAAIILPMVVPDVAFDDVKDILLVVLAYSFGSMRSQRAQLNGAVDRKLREQNGGK